MDPSQIDYINLHGTGTEANDAAELQGIKTLFGERARHILLSSTKSQIGHTLGAAGSIELVATIVGMARGFAPPTLNLVNPIVGFEHWSYVRDSARPAAIRAALSNSFGFAGNLATIAIRCVVDGTRASN
jgi:3-oxoacyl-[acyl-carrier-protein] synthase II